MLTPCCAPGDWNERFLEALNLPDSASKWERLTQLSGDFVDTAKVFGRILISELFKPDHEKTLSIKRVGGTAGGQKYVVSSILFKLVQDPRLSSSMWMYGGSSPNYEYAMKSAGLELLGAVTTFRFHANGLFVPMQALVDHHGFRMIAMPWLPLHQASLRNPSSPLIIIITMITVITLIILSTIISLITLITLVTLI